MIFPNFLKFFFIKLDRSFQGFFYIPAQRKDLTLEIQQNSCRANVFKPKPPSRASIGEQGNKIKHELEAEFKREIGLLVYF